MTAVFLTFLSLIYKRTGNNISKMLSFLLMRGRHSIIIALYCYFIYLHFSSASVVWVSLPAVLDQARVSRVWLFLTLATTVRPVATRPLAIVPPGRLEGRSLKMPGANIICLRAPVQVMLSPLGQPQLRLFLFFPKALSIASFLQRKCINSYGQILLR